MKRGLLVLAVAAVFCAGFPALAQINEGFDSFQIGVRPAGWQFIFCNSNDDADMLFYGIAAPGIKLGSQARTRIITAEYDLDGAPGDSDLSFYLQAISSNPSSALQVREYDGDTTSWSVLTWLPGPHNLSGETVTLALNASTSQQVEIEYLQVDGTGLVIDDVAITNVTTDPTPVPPAPQPSPIYLVVAADDYSGGGDSDIAVYNQGTGDWQIGGVGTENFGGGEYDFPAPGDYDGDGVADLGYFDRGTARWFAQSVGGGTIIDGELWGVSGDVPVPGDYDGDGTTDLAVWRPSNGYWYVRDITSILYGYDGVLPVPGDYTGDGTTDIAVINTNDFGTWRWFVNGVAGSRAWGVGGDIPVPGVYVDDGHTYLAAYRPGTGRWWYRRRDGLVTGTVVWGGQVDDVPVVGDFDGDGVVDATIFRTPDEWLIRNVGTETLAPNESAAVVVTGATGY